jgi:hypothetical protein
VLPLTLWPAWRRAVRNDVLGRYSLSHDPCKAEKVWGEMYMTDSLKALLQRSAQRQAADAAAGGTAGAAIELPGAEEAAAALQGDVADGDVFRRRNLLYEWQTPPMVMHKIANPLHLHYLHWRVHHCKIPRDGILDPAAIVNAQASMPSVSALFALPALNRDK